MNNKIRFHLPGLTRNFILNMSVLQLMKTNPEFFKDNIEIASFFGDFPTTLWGGGRYSGKQCSRELVKQISHSINSAGIPMRFTFTNLLLTEEDLYDPYCNFIMELNNNGMNEVLVTSKVLEDYIRDKYPKYKINSSTCKEIRDINTLKEELSKDYNLVVLDYNLNNRWDILDQIERKDKVELLVNACCKPNCKRRGEHYRNISLNNKIYTHNKTSQVKRPLIDFNCYNQFNTLHDLLKSPCAIPPNKINEYVSKGFNNFKIEGRNATLYFLIEDFSIYLAKEEYQSDFRSYLYMYLDRNKLLNIREMKSSEFI